MFVLGEDVLPVWLRFCIGVPARVLLPDEDPVVGWFTGVLPAACRAVIGDGTLRGGEDWFTWEGVETLPPGFLEPGGVGVAMFYTLAVSVVLRAWQCRPARAAVKWTKSGKLAPIKNDAT